MIFVDGMQSGMGNLMDQGLQVLHLTHAELDSNPMFHLMIISPCTRMDVFELHRHWGCLFDGFKEHRILLHAVGQFMNANGGDLPSFCLADIEDRYDFECRNGDLFFLLHRLAVFSIDWLMGVGIDPGHHDRFLIGCRSQNLNGFFALFDCPSQFLFPLVKAGYQRGVRFLHGDQQCVVEAVIMKLGHGIQVGAILFAVKQIFQSGLQLVGDLFDPFCTVLTG